MAFSGKKALVKVGGDPVPFSDASTIANTARTEYTIEDVSKRTLDRTAIITVQTSPDGTAWTTAIGCSVSRLSGKVIFDAAQPEGTQVRVSGQYIPMSVAAECHEWSLTINNASISVPVFLEGWDRKISGLKDGSGSVSKWWDIDPYFEDALLAGEPVVLELYPQDTLNPFRIWALINSKEMAAAVDGAVEDTVSFESTNELILK